MTVIESTPRHELCRVPRCGHGFHVDRRAPLRNVVSSAQSGPPAPPSTQRAQLPRGQAAKLSLLYSPLRPEPAVPRRELPEPRPLTRPRSLPACSSGFVEHRTAVHGSLRRGETSASPPATCRGSSPILIGLLEAWSTTSRKGSPCGETSESVPEPHPIERAFPSAASEAHPRVKRADAEIRHPPCGRHPSRREPPQSLCASR